MAVLQAALGGALIGLASAGWLLYSGQVTGISGVVSGALSPRGGDLGWRLAFIVGLVVGGALLVALSPARMVVATGRPLWLMALAGVLVGVGTRMSGGCTSGHGVCGVSRGSARSLVATGTFMLVAMAVVLVVDRVLA